MLKWIETTGKTERDALNKALKELGLEEDDISIEVITRAKTGFLGIGSCPAKIRVTYEVPDEPAPVAEEPAPTVEPEAPAEPIPPQRRNRWKHLWKPQSWRQIRSGRKKSKPS